MKDLKKRMILIHGIGIIVARAMFFGMNPLAIGYFTAIYMAKAGTGLGMIAVMIGISTVMSSFNGLRYFMALITAWILLETPWVKKRKLPKALLYFIPILPLMIYSFMEAMTFGLHSNDVVLLLLEATIAYVSAHIFKKGIDYLKQPSKGIRMNHEQIISMAVIVAIVVFATPNITNSYVAPVETVVFFLTLFYMYKYGVGQGAVTGAVCGLAMSLRGEPISLLGMLSIMGIMPSVFRELGRIPTATIYMITAALMSMLFEGMTLTVPGIGALISAVLLFLLLPKSFINPIDERADSKGMTEMAVPSVKNIANTRMKTFSESFLKLSKTFTKISEYQTSLRQQEINGIFDDISDKLCRNCKNCSRCWESNVSQTYQAASKVFEMATKKGMVLKEDIPEEFADSCICADEFIKETNRGFEIARINQIWQNRMAESREVIAEQLREVSNVIQEMSSNIYEIAEVSSAEEEKIIRRLKMEHVITDRITMIERIDKRKELYLSAACSHGYCLTAKQAAQIISDVLGIRMRVSDSSKTVISKKLDEFIFVEDTKFKVLTGVARAMKEGVSGDNFSVLKMENGEVMLAISDGMGTGKDASEESEMVVSLLEQMTEAGFKAETAIKLINSSLVLKNREQSFSTVDMSLINLFTGMCEFVKIGAAATFIKRNNWVETITSTTLPIGMLQNVDFDNVTKKLYEGDILIMVSDGVLDCIQQEDKEEFMEKLIMEINSNNPQEIANRIINKTLAQRNYVPLDDMTVITAGLWLK